MSAVSPFFRLESVRRSFGHLLAVDGVSFDVSAGEVVGIVGPNGSGKTTLLNVISGIYRPTAGQVFFRGERIDHLRRYARARLGLSRTFQNLRVFPSLDAAQHCVVAHTAVRLHQSWFASPQLFRRPWKPTAVKAAKALAEVFAGKMPDGPVRVLPYGQRRRIELARCLAGRPSMLLLDEMTSGLNDFETAELKDALARILAERALTALVVDHKFDFVRALCSRVIVMERGRVIADGSADEVARDGKVIEAYFGLEAA